MKCEPSCGWWMFHLHTITHTLHACLLPQLDSSICSFPFRFGVTLPSTCWFHFNTAGAFVRINSWGADGWVYMLHAEVHYKDSFIPGFLLSADQNAAPLRLVISVFLKKMFRSTQPARKFPPLWPGKNLNHAVLQLSDSAFLHLCISIISLCTWQDLLFGCCWSFQSIKKKKKKKKHDSSCHRITFHICKTESGVGIQQVLEDISPSWLLPRGQWLVCQMSGTGYSQWSNSQAVYWCKNADFRGY